ncbi:MAG TPA: hypothetical protein VFC54_07185 [Pseudolabrys sp.]|nr:hypothetical protein [Pseudolabrys sp.]
MPAHLPNRSRADVIRDKREIAANAKLRVASQRKPDAIETIDWLAIWALSLGFSAIFMTSFVYFNDHDARGATAILVGTAIIIAFALFASKAPARRD